MRQAWVMWLMGLGLAVGGFAWAEDAGPTAGDAPKRAGGAGMGQQGQGRPDGLKAAAGGPLGLIANEAPAVKEENKRYFEAVKSLLDETRTLGQQIRQEGAALRKAGDDKAQPGDVATKHAAQAEEIAGKLADLLATHHANLAKIYQEKQGDLVKKMGEGILKRITDRNAQGGPGGPNGQGRPDRGWRGRGDGPAGGGPAPKNTPENF